MMTATETDKLTNYRLTTIEDAVKSIAENLSQLTVLEQKHIETRAALSRAFDQIDGHDKRLRSVEIDMPTLKMVRTWVVTGVVGVVSLVGIAAFKVFIAG